MSFIWSSVTGLMRKATSALPEMDAVNGLGGFAVVADVVAGADGFFVEAQEFFDDDLVELGDVECGLAGAGCWRAAGDGLGFELQQEVAVAGDREKGDRLAWR